VTSPGPGNAITDVPGVLVGHHQRLGDGWATGSTVVLVPDGAVGGVDNRGGAPGTRETDLLAPGNLVQRVQAVCLSGGSAYGLAAADGVMRWLAEHHLGFPVGPEPHQVVPIVPAAVLFDLPSGEWGNRPDAEFGYRATEAAWRSGPGAPVAQGTVGAGTGARCGTLKGGIGTASAVVGPHTVGALLAVNAMGEAVDPTGRPWAADLGHPGEFPRFPLGSVDVAPPAVPGPGPLNTTVGVVAVDAALAKAECQRIAAVAQDGLARALRPAHSLFDGDTLFTLATGTRELTPADATPALGGESSRAAALDRLALAAADVVARAVVHAILSATAIPGLPAHPDRWPRR
jgi:L-aminopeptidase/D-esterase-like protein